jgi:hypothetical protein
VRFRLVIAYIGSANARFSSDERRLAPGMPSLDLLTRGLPHRIEGLAPVNTRISSMSASLSSLHERGFSSVMRVLAL